MAAQQPGPVRSPDQDLGRKLLEVSEIRQA